MESFADSKLLDFSNPGQLTFRINRKLGVSCYIYGIGLIVIRMCEGYKGGVRGHMDEVGKKTASSSVVVSCPDPTPKKRERVWRTLSHFLYLLTLQIRCL